MANRYDIVRIDFQASARGANAAIESLRKEAEKSSARLNEMRDNIDKAFKAGASDEVIAGMRAEAKTEERRYKQLSQAQNELIKGMRVLDQGVKMFNDGSLNQMNAAFQKAVNNAAKLAQNKFDAGSKEWREMGAIMQETEQNYARMQRDTEQLVQVIQNGGTVFKNTLEQEKKGLQELMGLVPYMGTEYQRLEGHLQTVTAKLEQMTIAERQARGEIATTNDARRVSYQLTEEGAAAAKREAEAAEQTISAGKQRIALLEEERSKQESAARATAEAVAKRNEDLAMQEGVIKSLEKEILNEDRKGKKKREAAAVAKKAAEESAKAVDTEKAALEGLQATTKAADEKVKQLEEDLEKLGQIQAQAPANGGTLDELKKDAEEAETKLASLRQSLQRIQELKSNTQSEVNSAKETLGDIDDNWNIWKNERVKKALEEDRAAQEQNIAKLEARWNEYWEKQEEQARKFAATLGKTSTGDVQWDEFYTHVTGPNSELAKSWYRTNFRDSSDVGYWAKDSENYKELVHLRASKNTMSASDEQLEELKILESLKRKWEDYQRALSKARNDTPKYNAAYIEIEDAHDKLIQKGAMLEVYNEHELQLKQQIAEQEKIIAEARQKGAISSQKESEDTNRQQKDIETLTGDINSLSDAIKALKDQRDALTASQKSGAEAAAKDAKAIQMTKEEAQAARDEMIKKSSIHIKTNGDVDYSNIEEVQSFIISKINGNVNEKGLNTKPELAKKGVFQLENPNQVKNLVNMLRERYGIEEKSDAVNILKGLVSGKEGGIFGKGFVDMEAGQLKIQTNEKRGERIARMKELNAIIKGTTQATEQQTAAIEKNADAEKRQVEVEQQKAALSAQITALEEQRQQKQEQLNQLQQQATQTSASQTSSIENLAEEEKKLIQLQKELKQAMTDAGYADKSPDKIDVFASMNRSARTGFMNETAHSRIWAHQFGGDSPMKDWVEGHAKTLAERDSYFTALSKETIKDSLSGYLTNNKTLADVKAMQAEWKKVASSFTNNPETNKGYYQDAVLYIDRLVEKTAQLKEIQEKRSAVKNQQAIVDGLKQQAESTEKTTQATEQSADADKKAVELTNQLTDAKKELATAQQNQEAQQKKVDEAIVKANSDKEKSVKMEEELAKASADKTAELEKEKKTLVEMEAAAQKDVEQNNKRQEELRKTNEQIAAEGNIIREAETKKVQAQTNSIKATEEAIRLLREENNTIQFNSEQWRKNAADIQRLEAALDKMKGQAALQMMTDRMGQVSRLSSSALTETKRFWETMVAGAEKGSQELKVFEGNLKVIAEEERQRNRAALEASAKRLNGGLGNLSQEELRQAINDAKLLQSSYKSTSKDAQELAAAIVNAEEHVKRYGVEAERAARKQEESDKRTARAARDKEEAEFQEQQSQQALMRQRIAERTSLSAAALVETKKYWQAVKDGAQAGTIEEEKAMQVMRMITAEEQRRATIANEAQAGILSGNLSTYSEQEVRAAIEAGKQLIQTYKVGSDEANALAKNIVNAEEYIKQYGVEAERAAVREAKAIEEVNRKRQETNQLMEQQLQRDTGLSQSALKAQENYWQRLIDDPKAAANELAYYYEQLNKVHRIQEEQASMKVTAGGISVLQRMRSDVDYESKISDDQRKKDLAALKAYRDALPKEGNASVLKEIDYYLGQLGATAKEGAQAVMSLADAEVLAGKLGTRGFSASTNQLQQAKKALIDAQQAAGRGTPRFTELQNAINKVNLELGKTGEITADVQAVLDKPKGQSLNALKQAVEQGRAALQNMDRTTKKGQDAFDELAKKIKETELELKRMSGEARATTSAFEKAWSRLKTYVGLYVGASVAMNKLVGTIGDIHELSDRMGEVGKTTQMSADEVGRLTENLKKIDTRTGIVQLLELSAAAGQLGLKSEEDIQGFTEAANKLMVAMPEMGREAATEMMRVAIATGEVNKIQKEMQDGTIEGSSATAVAMEKIASTIDRLRASSASAAPEITDFVKRVGAVGAQSGISIDQVAALGSTVSSLGMRVEMSATALSRMIPAIKGNAFELSKAIGVTPDTIRNLFDAGRGMDVILMILQRIKDSGMDADSIENMLGMAGMKDIMKDLNQQGARAGIVFSGLSQNVDELRRQLGVAKEAYEENIAIQNEYNRMNDTTAARWQRLKNQVEEMFVGVESERMIGGLIKGLQWLLSLITENGRAFAYAAVAIGTFKIGLGAMVADGITKLKGLKFSIDSVKKSLLTWPNLWNAIATVAVFAIMKIVESATSLGEISKSMGEVEKQLRKEMITADRLFRSLAKVREEERRAAEAAKEQTAAEEKKSKATDRSTEKTNKLSKETEKLSKSEKNAAEQAGKMEDGMKRVNTEGSKSAAIIREINSKYGTYLGYMMSETSSARQLADARELINKKLRETITLKQKEAAMADIEQNYGSKVREGASSTDNLIAWYFGGNDEAYARVSVAVNEAVQKYAKDSKKFNEEIRRIVSANRKYISQGAKKDFKNAYAQSGRGGTDYEIVSGIASNIGVRAEDYRKSVAEYQNQTETANRVFEARTNVLRKDSREATVKTLYSIMADWREVLDKYKKAEGEEKEKLAVEVYKQQRAYNNLFANNADYFTNDNRKGVIERTIKNMKTYEKGLRSVADESIRAVDAAERAETKITGTDFTNGGNSSNTPWGNALGGESTDWKNMTAEQLVNRRKQMKDFVNAIQTDTDVKAVLEEDAALKKAIEKGMSSDMRTVIEWYNTERLKIQDELHARHLTNTGDWLDPKKQKNAYKQFQNEISTYLHELDAYYTERKTRIEEAGTDEGLTEAEIRNRTLSNEMEWHQRRAELQKLYARKSGEVTKEEQNAIYHIIAERTGDTEKFVRQTIGRTNNLVNEIEKSNEKGAAIVHKWLSKLGLDVERDYMRQQQALTKQMKAIEDIIDKERPFNGITKNLQESLATMDILTGDMRKEYNELMMQGKDTTEFNARQAQEEMKRTAFMLGEAENAYSTTIDRVLSNMRENGMAAWADWLQIRPEQQEATMAQLRSTYDAIQDAIKKEASQLKKQAEIMWNNILMPDGQTTLKQTTDRVIAQLGMDEGRVKRANSLIGAGQASERVADKLAIKQMQIQLAMQEHYYNLMRKQGLAHIEMLEDQAKAAKKRGDTEEATRKTLDAQHARMSLNLATAKEETELAKQREEIVARTEESQNRLYTELKSWADLLSGSLKSIFEASHAGDAEYYNERAKLNLTGKGGPGAGTYVVIDNEGTSDAKAHYEYLNDREALERQREIERQNALAEAWGKVMDDINMKMSDTITDIMNASLQNASVDANTDALGVNTDAMNTLTGAVNSLAGSIASGGSGGSATGLPEADDSNPDTWARARRKRAGLPVSENPHDFTGSDGGGASLVFLNPEEAGGINWAYEQASEAAEISAQSQIESIGKVDYALSQHFHSQVQDSADAGKKMAAGTQSAFAKMTQAANLYGIAYQAMSNDNLSATQKFEMIAIQAAGQAAITSLTTSGVKMVGDTAVQTPSVLSKIMAELGPIAGPVAFGAFTALLGGLMGLAMSKLTKAKSQIASVTGAGSVGAGRLSTGMLTYAAGNVNEFTDPATLTPGRTYNVDAADGKTYRAKYMGKNPRTHITNGPEFHLAGEAGREAIIDARTTRHITMNEGEIWRAIQTLSAGGRIRHSAKRGGVAAFADGNIDDFDGIASNVAAGGISTEQAAALQASIDRQNDLLERALTDGIKGVFDVHGPDGLVASYDKGKKMAQRHGERY